MVYNFLAKITFFFKTNFFCFYFFLFLLKENVIFAF